ncbi:hypothetical protein ABT034_34815 [Streptomyces sp. NPDC002773]|uniref:hypothetical protein n=1 Tax=Streptomyces sp. NPDC002773 TaxID=3154430 RepID=UPI00331CC119
MTGIIDCPGPSSRSWTGRRSRRPGPGGGRDQGAASPVRRLVRLSAEVWFHPYWARPRPGAGRAELLDQARAQHREKASA